MKSENTHFQFQKHIIARRSTYLARLRDQSDATEPGLNLVYPRDLGRAKPHLKIPRDHNFSGLLT